MSAYTDGLEVLTGVRSPARASARPGTGAVVGNEVEDRLRPLRASWLSLKRDIATARTAGTVSEEFQRTFLEDWTSFEAFYNAHIGDWLVTHTTLNEIEQRRQRLESWRTAFTSLGGTSTSPATAPPAPGILSRATEGGGALGAGGTVDRSLNQIALIAGIVVTGVVVANVAGLFRH